MPVLDLVRTFILFLPFITSNFVFFIFFFNNISDKLLILVSSLNVPLTCYLQQHHLHHLQDHQLHHLLSYQLLYLPPFKTLPTALPIAPPAARPTLEPILSLSILHHYQLPYEPYLLSLQILLQYHQDVPIISVTYSSFCYLFDPVPFLLPNSTTYTTYKDHQQVFIPLGTFLLFLF